MWTEFLYFFIPGWILISIYALGADTEFRDDGNVVGGILFSGVVSFVLMGIVFSLYAGVKRDNLEVEERVTASYNLVALDANEDINGSFEQAFFVGSGYISEDLYYHFFYETSKGIKYEKVRAEYIYIIETDGDPKYVKYGYYMIDTESPYYREGEKRKSRSVLYIPEGTIKTNYKVN